MPKPITYLLMVVDKPRLVRAKNSAHALRHVVADTITCTRATVDDVHRLRDVPIEDAGAKQ